MQTEHFRIPDRVFTVLAIIVLGITWAMLIWAWPLLPKSIPTHFGPSGAADAWGQKSFWSVFLVAVIPTIMGGLFWWLYRHPQYSNIPSTILISMMPEPERSILFRILRHLLVILYVLMTIIFADIALAIISVGFDAHANLNPWLLFGLLAFMLFVVSVYTVWIVRIAKQGAQKVQAPNSSA